MHCPILSASRARPRALLAKPLLCAVALSFCVGSSLQGGLAEREANRRQARNAVAETLAAEGLILLSQKMPYEAVANLRQAYEQITESPRTEALRTKIREDYVKAAIAAARKAAKEEGDLSKALGYVEMVLDPSVAPNHKGARDMRTALGDPLQFPIAATPEHVKKVKDVTWHLRQGQSNLEIGKYDQAEVEYQRVLQLDPYNRAARRGLEKVEQERQRYYESAHDHTRSKMLGQVGAQWESPVPLLDETQVISPELSGAPVGQSISRKMQTLIVPNISFADATLSEVTDFLRSKATELDTTETDPTRRGVNILLDQALLASDQKISMTLSTPTPLQEILHYVVELAGVKYQVDQFAVRLVPLTALGDALITKSYKVAPNFIESLPDGNAAGPSDAMANPFETGGATNVGGGLTLRRQTAKEFLTQRGLVFPEGASANFITSSSTLVVRNTQQNLDLLEQLLENALNTAPRMVEITATMLEVNQNNLKELGYDWLMSEFNLPGSERVFAGGGTPGNTGVTDATDFSFREPGGAVIGRNPITAGNRSTGQLTNGTSIDSLLGGQTSAAAPASSRSPGAFAVSGVFTDPQFQTVMRGLNQKKGVDILASPTIVTKGGVRATVNLFRELPYPTEFDPPEVPQTVSGNVVPPIIPTNPTAFEVRNTGISLEVEPVISQDNRTIDLNIVPTSVEFEGYINYGGAVSTVTPDGTSAILINDRILQPIFRTNRLSTSVSIYDGATVVLGGALVSRTTDINDKTPIFGDLPYLGRFFRSKVKLTEKKNVLFFVRVRLIDPGGRSLSGRDNLRPTQAPVKVEEVTSQFPLRQK